MRCVVATSVTSHATLDTQLSSLIVRIGCKSVPIVNSLIYVNAL